MKLRFSWRWSAQCVLVLLCAFALKLHYSTASANQLRWVLAPTTSLVELVSGTSFEFESYAGYISRDRNFLIENSCAGVNFLITAFLMLAARRLLSDPSQQVAWGFIPVTAILAYLATLVANTVRISVALRPERIGGEASWLNPDQLHRLEGILVYFGCLMLLFLVSEKVSSDKPSGFLRQSGFPLMVYYTTTLGVPLANGAYSHGEFWEHSIFVVLIPLLVILPIAAFRCWLRWRGSAVRTGSAELDSAKCESAVESHVS